MPEENVTTAAPNNTTGPAESSAIVQDDKVDQPAETADDPKPTTAAPNSTTGVAEMSAVIQNGTTEEPAKEKSESAPSSTKLSPAMTQLWAAAQPLLTSTHPEIWGVYLADPAAHVPSQIVLQKYLNANDQDVEKAVDQLTKTLEWRAKTKPLELLKRKFNRDKFGGLGYVTVYEDQEEKSGGEGWDPEKKEVFTWNIYGGVKNVDETFGNLEEFLNWRVALMELSLSSPRYLSLSTATVPLTTTDPTRDPYKITQVHDYKSISFMRQSPTVKSASQETIKVFAQNYPELLKEKFFVNVPAVMGFVYEIIKRFVAERTRRRFHPMSNGGNLSREFGRSKVAGLGDLLPADYGGKGEGLGKGQGVELELE